VFCPGRRLVLFFFQAEDGIRDFHVTGVQTCALPISAMGLISLPVMLRNGYNKELSLGVISASGTLGQIIPPSIVLIVLGDQMGRSEERRVGKEGRSRWWPDHE